MKKKSLLAMALFAVVGLSGCVVSVPALGDGAKVGVSTSQSTVSGPYKLADNHFADVAKLKSEAERLAIAISSGQITKVQAANQLNKYRLSLVGSNTVDDNVFQTYLNAAIDSESGKIKNEQSKYLVKSTLEGWQTRWKSLPDSQKPRNPAFTNFLNEVMGLPYLK